MKKAVKKQPKSIDDKLDELARIMAGSFAALQQDIASIKTVLITKADRADVLALHDKFVHRREFDELSLRVSKIEEKVRR